MLVSTIIAASWLLFVPAAADSPAVARGEKIFNEKCASAACHAPNGSTGKAPRLLGRKFEHTAVIRALRVGTPNMPSYSKMPLADLEAVTSYVLSLEHAGASSAAKPGGASSQAGGGDKTPEQAQRGRELFFAASNPNNCGVCHVLSGKGTAVGPDLTRLARINARAIAMAVTSTRTQYAVIVKPKTGKDFPAMKVEEGETISVYDLSTTPPTLRKFPKEEVGPMVDNNVWKHPPSVDKLSAEQMADIIAYIRYAAYGDKLGVKPADVE
jgi:mono/diheme cytochrome c family protein